MGNTGKRVIDIAMCVLLPLLMAYSLIGETLHELLGILMLCLVVIHHVLNRAWFRALPKGRYRPSRILWTGMDLLLLIIMLLQPISGILMSKHVFSFLHLSGVSATARKIHLVLAYWCLLLSCIHAGTHLTSVWNRVRRIRAGAKSVILIVAIMICLYGCYVFLKRQLPGYMFCRIGFAFIDTSESKLHFFADYLSIMFLFGVIGMVLKKISGKQHITHNQRKL